MKLILYQVRSGKYLATEVESDILPKDNYGIPGLDWSAQRVQRQLTMNKPVLTQKHIEVYWVGLLTDTHIEAVPLDQYVKEEILGKAKIWAGTLLGDRNYV